MVRIATALLLALLVSACSRVDASGHAGVIAYKQQSEKKHRYHSGRYRWCVVKVSGAQYWPPKHFYTKHSPASDRPFRECAPGPDAKISALALDMYNDLLGERGWHILRLEGDQAVLNYVSRAKPRWSEDGAHVLFRVFPVKEGEEFCRLDVRTGETSPVPPATTPCKLPLADTPKHVTYRRLQDALRDPLDVHILDLSNQNLHELPAEIGRLQHLERLDLEGNLHLSLPAEFGKLTALKELNLRNTFLERVPAEFSNLKELRKLSLGGTKLSAGDKAQIAQALPECEIQ